MISVRPLRCRTRFARCAAPMINCSRRCIHTLLYRTGRTSLQSPSDTERCIALIRMLAYVQVVSSMPRRVSGALSDLAVPRIAVVLVNRRQAGRSHSFELMDVLECYSISTEMLYSLIRTSCKHKRVNNQCMRRLNGVMMMMLLVDLWWNWIRPKTSSCSQILTSVHGHHTRTTTTHLSHGHRLRTDSYRSCSTTTGVFMCTNMTTFSRT